MDKDPGDNPPQKKSRNDDSGGPSHSSITIGSSRKNLRKDLVRLESAALSLTKGDGEHGRPIRNLTDFFIHNSRKIAQSFETLMSGQVDLFITGLVMPMDNNIARSVSCEHFAQVMNWEIAGYVKGSAEIWICTEVADYICIKPAPYYEEIFAFSFRKALTCVEVFKNLSKLHGGNPDMSLDELLARVVNSLCRRDEFSGTSPITDYVIAEGVFIYKQLCMLDEIREENDQIFTDLPILVSLREECMKWRPRAMRPPPPVPRA